MLNPIKSTDRCHSIKKRDIPLIKTNCSPFVVCCVIALSQVAQSEEIRIVGPPGLESRDGNLSVPNDPSTILRVQELWSSSFFSDLPPGGAWLVGQSARLDGRIKTDANFTRNLQLSVSTSPRNSISLTFAQNIGSDVVHGEGLIVLTR